MIKIQDIAYVRYAVPDLEAMARFAAEFGLVRVSEDADVLYHRGTDPSPYCHVAEQGDPAFVALGLEAASRADLERVATIEGASAVEQLEGPGGGLRVSVSDPDGFRIDVVHGRDLLDPLPVATAAGVNRGSERTRLGSVHRPPQGPSSVRVTPGSRSL